MTIPVYPNGRINFDAIVEEYATSTNSSFGRVVKFLSERNSLQIGAQLLGLDTSEVILNELGNFLDRKGCRVPKLYEMGQRQFKKEDGGNMPLNLTKEEYLDERRKGKTRSRIAREQGIQVPSLYHYLEKWGIRDSAVEEAALDLAGPSKNATESPANLTNTDKESATLGLTFGNYLLTRASGLTRKEAFSKFKVGPVNGTAQLKEWGIDDRKVEKIVVEVYKNEGLAKAMAAIHQKPDVVATTPSAAEKPKAEPSKAATDTKSSDTVTKPQATDQKTDELLTNPEPANAPPAEAVPTSKASFWTIRIPVKDVSQFQSKKGKQPSFTRDAHLSVAVLNLVEVLASAAEDVTELLGPDADVFNVVQDYINRKLAETEGAMAYEASTN